MFTKFTTEKTEAKRKTLIRENQAENCPPIRENPPENCLQFVKIHPVSNEENLAAFTSSSATWWYTLARPAQPLPRTSRLVYLVHPCSVADSCALASSPTSAASRPPCSILLHSAMLFSSSSLDGDVFSVCRQGQNSTFGIS